MKKRFKAVRVKYDDKCYRDTDRKDIRIIREKQRGE